MQTPDDGHRETESCPCCRMPMRSHAVLCIDCGFDRRTGTRIQGVAAPQPTPIQSDNPYHAPQTISSNANQQIDLSWAWALVLPNRRATRRVWWLTHFAWISISIFLDSMQDAAILHGSDISLIVTTHRLFTLCMLWPLLTVNVNRWHDMDRSGLWMLFMFIPCFGQLYALVELGFDRGTEGPNDYGNDPRGA